MAKRDEEIRARCEAATPGPWRYMAEDEQLTYLSIEHGGVKIWDIFGAIRGEENGDFIAHAREDIPYLQDRVAALEAKLQTAQDRPDANLADCDAWQRRAEAAEAEVRRNAVLMAVHGLGGYELSAQRVSDVSGPDAGGEVER